MQNLWTFVLALFTAIIGFLIRSLFDSRDLRRKILDGPFNQFEEVTTQLAGFYKQNLSEINFEIELVKMKQSTNNASTLPGGTEIAKENYGNKINDLYTKMTNYVNESKFDLIKAKNNIIWASRRFKDDKIENLIKIVYTNLLGALKNYDSWHFEAKGQRKSLAQDEYQAYSKGLKAAQDYFDNEFREDMKPLYRRYWHLSTRVGLLNYPWDDYKTNEKNLSKNQS